MLLIYYEPDLLVFARLRLQHIAEHSYSVLVCYCLHLQLLEIAEARFVAGFGRADDIVDSTLCYIAARPLETLILFLRALANSCNQLLPLRYLRR